MPRFKVEQSQVLRQFFHSTGGNVALMFALVMLPVFGIVGLAVDYSYASSVKTALQNSIDSAGLMVSRDADGSNLSEAELNRRAQAYFDGLFNADPSGVSRDAAVSATPLKLNITSDPIAGFKVKIEAAAVVQTQFLRIIGFPTIPIGISTTTNWGSTRMRVALALDVTGSMDGEKLKSMKQAANGLVDILLTNAKSSEDIYVSIVPFAAFVNVGKGNINASFLKWDVWDARKYGKRELWTGCVTDRDDPADTTDAPPTLDKNRYPAVNYIDPPTKQPQCPSDDILKMTPVYDASDVKKLKDKISNLTALGGTNQPIGMAWAWATLKADGPFGTPPKDKSRRYTNVIITLSDGANTFNRNNGDGRAYEPAVDARQKILCKNIKATNSPEEPMMIYTIQVKDVGEAESAVLKECADAGNFFSTTSASGIQAIFTQIANTLIQLRLSE